eukprot:gene7206-14696_t
MLRFHHHSNITEIWRGDRRILNRLSSNNCFPTGMALDDVLKNWPGNYRIPINGILHEIAEDKDFELLAKSSHIDSQTWKSFLSSYRRMLVKNPLDAFQNNKNAFLSFIEKLPITNDADMPIDNTEFKKFLFSTILKQAEESLGEQRNAYKQLCNKSDLRVPHEWYAYARLMKRKIIYHGGPTNSGKTYQALKRLREADASKGGGLYCGPLRLLALEVYEQLNRNGVYCDLLTGQEQRQVPFSTHTSCTVEMVNINREYDVAVIDEIQMIADGNRGYAWTRALQGLRAREVHVCGGSDASNIVESFARDMGDDFELKLYERLSPLKILDQSLRGDYSKIQPGDCVVAFSRSDIFSIKREIERLTPYRCCTIYGQLPPETRSAQARLFNDDNTGYDVLVASDAIGMGLNLNIRRIVFHSVVKKGKPNEGSYWVDPSSVRQIGGRAGRLSSAYKHGEVTAWQDADLAYIRAAMEWELPQITQVGLFPSVEQIETFSGLLHTNPIGASTETTDSSTIDTDIDIDSDIDIDNDSIHSDGDSSNALVETSIRLSHLLGRFVELAQMDGRYYICDHEDMKLVSNWLHTIPMTLADRFTFANAPASTRDSMSMNSLYQFAATYAQGRPVALNIRLPKYKVRDVIDLTDLCAKHNILDLYLWLSFRFPKYFIERDLCIEQKEYAISLIDSALNNTSLQQKYNHIEDYQKIRKTMLSRGGKDALLPQQWPSVRKNMKIYLDAIPSELQFVFPDNNNNKTTSLSSLLSASGGDARDRDDRSRNRSNESERGGRGGNNKKESRIPVATTLAIGNTVL